MITPTFWGDCEDHAAAQCQAEEPQAEAPDAGELE